VYNNPGDIDNAYESTPRMEDVYSSIDDYDIFPGINSESYTPLNVVATMKQDIVDERPTPVPQPDAPEPPPMRESVYLEVIA